MHVVKAGLVLSVTRMWMSASKNLVYIMEHALIFMEVFSVYASVEQQVISCISLLGIESKKFISLSGAGLLPYSFVWSTEKEVNTS